MLGEDFVLVVPTFAVSKGGDEELGLEKAVSASEDLYNRWSYWLFFAFCACRSLNAGSKMAMPRRKN